MKQIPDQLQRQIWATEQEILDVIHQVCTEYGCGILWRMVR